MVSPGKVEIGQGIVTALAQIAADELDVDIGRVQMVRASTAGSPNEGVTSGSLSVQQSGRAIRQACADIRQIFIAARKLNSISTALKRQFIAEIHRLHDGFEFVKAVRPPAEDVQQQVNLAGRFLFWRRERDGRRHKNRGWQYPGPLVAHFFR